MKIGGSGYRWRLRWWIKEEVGKGVDTGSKGGCNGGVDRLWGRSGCGEVDGWMGMVDGW